MSSEESKSNAGGAGGESRFRHVTRFRVRYGETDQMGTFYNAHALAWFEVGRTELFRHLGVPYKVMEERGVFLPVVEAHVKYLGRARYDDWLELTTALSVEGRARLRADERITNVETGREVVSGHTIHVFADRTGKPIRPPGWFSEWLR